MDMRWLLITLSMQDLTADDPLFFMKLFKEKSVTFHCHIWIQDEIYIQIRTNISSIGPVICETICYINFEKMFSNSYIYTIKL